jgi:hypothetical protein
LSGRSIEQGRGRVARMATVFAVLCVVTASGAGAQEVPLLQARSAQPTFTYDLLVNQLLINDPVAFAMQHEKQLRVTKAQRDSLRQFERDLKQQRSPILRAAEDELSRPLPRSSQQFDPAALPPRVSEGYAQMLEATLAYAPRVNALLDSTQLGTLVELRASWTPPPPKMSRKQTLTVDQVRTGRTPPMPR